MTESLKASARRVQDYLTERGYRLQVRQLPDSTRSAKDAAAAIGCEVAQIAKSLVFKDADSDRPVLVIASGINRVSTDQIRQSLGLQLVQADGKFVKQRLGFAIGGVPPVAHIEPTQTLLDVELRQYPVIWAAAGTPNAVFELTPADLETMTAGQWLMLAE